MHRITFLGLLCLGCLLIGGLTLVGATEPADLTVEDSIDVPEETIEIEQDGVEAEDDVDSIAVVEPGEDLVVDVTLPEDESGDIDMFNEDGDREVSANRVQSGSTTFETDGMEPGTYMLALWVDGSIEALYPVIVSGYDLTVSHPAEIEEGEALTVTTELEYTHLDEPPEGVDVALHGNGDVRNIESDALDDTTYEATTELDGMDPGEYDLYVAARGGGEVDGYPLSLGATHAGTVTITEATDDENGGGQAPPDDGDDSDTGADDDSDGVNGEDDGSDDANGDEDDTNGEDEANGDGDGEENGDDDDSIENGADDGLDDDDDDDDDARENGEDDELDDEDQAPQDDDEANGNESVISPNGDPDDAVSDDSQPLSPLVVVVAVLGGAAVARFMQQ